jgi:hypothetical protein
MIVLCMANSGDVLPLMSRDSAQGFDGETEFPITIGRTYYVYAMTFYLGIAWYYILNDDGHYWPTWTPAPMFEIIDGALPESWQVGYFNFGREHQYPIISFPEWAEDHAFYERLVDGDDEAVRTFQRRRREVEAHGKSPES